MPFERCLICGGDLKDFAAVCFQEIIQARSVSRGFQLHKEIYIAVRCLLSSPLAKEPKTEMRFT